MHQLDQRLLIHVVELREQSRTRVCRPHQGTRGSWVDAALYVFIQTGCGETLEVGALSAFHVDNLYVLAGFDFVDMGGTWLDPVFVARIGQWVGDRRDGVVRDLGSVNEGH